METWIAGESIYGKERPAKGWRKKSALRKKKSGRGVGTTVQRCAGAARQEEEAGQESLADGLIEGRNAVTEALRAGAPIDKIYVSRGDTDRTHFQDCGTGQTVGN